MRYLLKKILIALSLVVVVIFSLNRLVFFNQGFLERTAAYITYPFMWVSSSISHTFHTMATEKKAYADLRAQYDILQKNYLTALDEIIALRARQHVYENIKELIEFKQRYTYPTALTAKILIKNIAPNEHYYWVNRGSSDGIKVNMIALYQNHLIGRVAEVYGNYSKVILITDQHCKIAAYTSTTHAQGIVQGYNCINGCNLQYVSHLCTIQDNDLVISSGQGLVFPEGFCLGKVVLHSLKEKELYYHIDIQPVINLEALHTCMLIDPGVIHPL
jgi:rod shape-determining protein MreC